MMAMGRSARTAGLELEGSTSIMAYVWPGAMLIAAWLLATGHSPRTTGLGLGVSRMCEQVV